MESTRCDDRHGISTAKMIRVCLIGAGAAGLCMARHLTAKKDLFDTSVFERSGDVGGLWSYSENIGSDEYGLPTHSSVYKNLRTNLPKEVMAFPDFPFPSHLESFMHHTTVHKYLEDYADHFSLKDVIHFHHNVETVKPTDASNRDTQWKVTVKDLETNELKDQIFDAVVVCNGHFSVPYIPVITGLETFPGFVVHSHHYRDPEEYKDKKVVLLGAGASGIDIALDIAEYAKTVYLSHNNNPLSSTLPQNVQQVKGIEKVDDTGVVYFMDGEKDQVDGILFCTGYKLSFPFLSEDCGITCSDFQISYLYKHLFNTKFPSMAIVGVTNKVCPFPQFHCQALLIVSVLSGQTILPLQKELEQSAKEDFEWRVKELGFKPKWAHKLGTLQWEYNDELCALAKCEKLKPFMERLYKFVHEQRTYHIMTYKKDNFKVTGDETWESV